MFVAQGSAGMDSDQQIEQMVSKMMAAKIGEVQEKVQEMRAEMMEKDREMEVMREEMQEKVDVIREAMEEKDNKVKKQLDVLEARNTELTSKLREVEQKSLRDLPYVLTCAFQSSWYTPGATITYERLTVDYNNSDKPGGVTVGWIFPPACSPPSPPATTPSPTVGLPRWVLERGSTSS